MRVLSSLRARLALLVLLVAVPAALLIHLFAVRAGEALLAQHPGSHSGHALLGQEILGLALLGAMTPAAAWIGSRFLAVRGPRALPSAREQLAGAFDSATATVDSPEPPFRDTLSELWRFWKEARRAVELAEADENRQSAPQASAPETPPP